MTADIAGSNHTGAGRVLVLDRFEELEALDRLPRELRDWLNNAPIKFSSAEVEQVFGHYLALGGLTFVLRAMDQQVLHERRAFAAAYRAKHRTPLPHMAAAA